jgi:hypothetical protein
MRPDGYPDDVEVLCALDKLLARTTPGHVVVALRAFLRTREAVARDFIGSIAPIICALPGADPGWMRLMRAEEAREEADRERERRDERDEFLAGLEEFRRESLAGAYRDEADPEEKRMAYARGDVYLEDFQLEFMDENAGFSRFIDEEAEAERYMRQGDHGTAARAFELLIDIYRHDTEVRHLFVDDDDFPDLDLSEVDDIDIEMLRRHHRECLEAIGVEGGGGTGAVQRKGRGAEGSVSKRAGERPGGATRAGRGRPKRRGTAKGGR